MAKRDTTEGRPEWLDPLHYRRFTEAGMTVLQTGHILRPSGQTLISGQRLRMVLKVTPEHEFVDACNAKMQYSEIAELFGIGYTSDVLALKLAYGVAFKRGYFGTEAVAPAVASEIKSLGPSETHVPVSLTELADRVVALTMSKLDEALDTRVKWVVAKALHDMSESIRLELNEGQPGQESFRQYHRWTSDIRRDDES